MNKVLRDVDLVIAENILSLPLNPRATAVVAQALAGRPALVHHHDLPWERPHLRLDGRVPDDPNWAHVTVTDHARASLASRGIFATTVRNAFDPRPRLGARHGCRAALGLEGHQLLVVQPTRAIPRKNVPGALELAEALGAAYWLVGKPEEGYGAEVQRLLAGAKVPVHWGPVPGFVGATTGIEHAYAAADLVALPSHYEGFGNPAVEAALQCRPAVVGCYPAAQELRALGFRWFEPGQEDKVAAFLTEARRQAPQSASRVGQLLRDNAAVARRHLNLDDLPRRLCAVLEGLQLRTPLAPPSPAGRAHSSPA